ncbi:MAG: terpene cyclase/mutase family protein, partial [Candidatus Thorarchaeota archaeon]|nr:terpene cyclase/mutase family protein [Candidatus Thorarchaeota archaeon]
PSDSVVRVDATYGAILSLNELGSLATRPPPVNLTKVLDALILRQWNLDRVGNQTGIDYERYGGFSEYLVGPVTMNMNMMGIILLDLLKNQADYPGITAIDIDRNALKDHINRTYTAEGGFSAIPGQNPDIVSTYQALFIIDFLDSHDSSLNARNIVNETATIEWINSCRSGDGFKLSPVSNTIGVTATAAGIMALDLLLDPSPVPGLQAATDWVLARQIEDYVNEDFIGGFEEGVSTEDPNFETTYFALKLLESSGDLVSVNQTTVTNFILNCQVEDGSWGYIPGGEAGSLVYAGQACELLNIIGDAASILASSEDPYSPGGLILDWRYLVLAGIIVVALVVAVVSVRRD